MTETSPLDRELLDENFEIDGPGLRELIDMYVRQAGRTIQELQAAIGAGQSDAVAKLAHKLAGSSAVCGAVAVVEPLRTLERCGCEGRLSDAAPMVETIAGQFELCHRLLEEYLTEKGV